ncbi:MAG: fructose-bisphosphatase class III [Luteolibacter sp.]
MDSILKEALPCDVPNSQRNPYGVERKSADLLPLAREVPNIECAIAEIARFAAELTLPKGTIHVISDIHGEDKKLRHVINNASGTLRPLIEQLLKDEMEPKQFEDFLRLIFYPAEVVASLERNLRDKDEQKEYAMQTLGNLFEVVRVLASSRSLKHARRLFPAEYRQLLSEILHSPTTDREAIYVEAIVDTLVLRGKVLHLIHLTCRLIRNLAIDELIIAGDCWDRGPRGDKVVDYLMQQPNVSFVWGNHDIVWLGACLGQEAMICITLRISLRYRRLFQLEEGYGIPMIPLEDLAREIYGDDPADCYMPKGEGMRDTTLVARMQKAVAIMQWKLEGQVIASHPEWGIQNRMLMHRIDYEKGTIKVDGVTYDLKDSHFPTVDPADPYELTGAERRCLSRLKASFMSSQKLWDHMQWMVKHGSMAVVREEQLIFHGCIPVDSQGEFLPVIIDGEAVAGRKMFEAIDKVIYRMMEGRPEKKDMDLLWYLWSGPHSPLFGKHKMATLERELIKDKTPHEEIKNPYYELIHEEWFCDKILEEFGVKADSGLIVNGHVPVKIDKGESPVKRSGKAITIDGAFSEAYGDHGFTLVLEPHRTFLAEHHHFESVEEAVENGADIIPTIMVVNEYEKSKTVADSRRGDDLKRSIRQLEMLIAAYRRNDLYQRDSDGFRGK